MGDEIEVVDRGRKITQAEMIAMFGEAMPSEAVSLVFNAPPSMTIGELRANLRTIASEKQRSAPDELTNITAGLTRAIKALRPFLNGTVPLGLLTRDEYNHVIEARAVLADYDSTRPRAT